MSRARRPGRGVLPRPGGERLRHRVGQRRPGRGRPAAGSTWNHALGERVHEVRASPTSGGGSPAGCCHVPASRHPRSTWGRVVPDRTADTMTLDLSALLSSLLSSLSRALRPYPPGGARDGANHRAGEGSTAEPTSSTTGGSTPSRSQARGRRERRDLVRRGAALERHDHRRGRPAAPTTAAADRAVRPPGRSPPRRSGDRGALRRGSAAPLRRETERIDHLGEEGGAAQQRLDEGHREVGARQRERDPGEAGAAPEVGDAHPLRDDLADDRAVEQVPLPEPAGLAGPEQASFGPRSRQPAGVRRREPEPVTEDDRRLRGRRRRSTRGGVVPRGTDVSGSVSRGGRRRTARGRRPRTPS